MIGCEEAMQEADVATGVWSRTERNGGIQAFLNMGLLLTQIHPSN